jgi:hypothetical protein
MSEVSLQLGFLPMGIAGGLDLTRGRGISIMNNLYDAFLYLVATFCGLTIATY